MVDPSPEESLDELRIRAEEDPCNESLRLELGKQLYSLGHYTEAIPHLQIATRNPHLRPAVMDLLSQTFEERGLKDMAAEIRRQMDEGDPPDEERPPDAGVRAPLKPDSPSSDSAAKKLPPDHEENA